jgi:3',5'-cyclic AMP phosphodiesterase CpdA
MRIALIADTHLSPLAPECIANWHVVRRAVQRLGVDLTLHLGDITLEGDQRPDELRFAAELVQQWPHPMLCVPGRHDIGDGLGDGSDEATPAQQRLQAFGEHFGSDRWALAARHWLLLGVNAQLFGSGGAPEKAQWQWLDEQARLAPPHAQIALFLHRPLLPAQPDARDAQSLSAGWQVPAASRARLLHGPLQAGLRLVVSGHMHRHLDRVIDGVRHLWLPSTAYVLDDAHQTRAGARLVGLGVLDLSDCEAAFDLWSPQGLRCQGWGDLAVVRQRMQARARAHFEKYGLEAL